MDASKMQPDLQLPVRKEQTNQQQCWNASNHDYKNARELIAITFAANVVRLQVGKKEETPRRKTCR